MDVRSWVVVDRERGVFWEGLFTLIVVWVIVSLIFFIVFCYFFD